MKSPRSSDVPAGPVVRETTMTATLDDVPDLLPARMLNEYTYCPRLFFLEWVQAEFADSADTVEGSFQHRRVDRERGTAPAPGRGEPGAGAETAEAREDPDSPQVATSLMLSDPGHGLIARIDLVEFDGTTCVPVDYKKGSVPSVPECAYEPERVQLCARASSSGPMGTTATMGSSTSPSPGRE